LTNQQNENEQEESELFQEQIGKNVPQNNLEYQKGLEEWIIERLIKKFSFITLSDTKEILFYQDGVYRRGGETMIETEVEKLYKRVSTPEVNEIKNHIRRRTTKDRRELNKDSHILNLKNCLFDTKEFKELPHSQKFLSTIQYPIKYNPKAKCPKILQFVKSSIYGPDAKKVLALDGLAMTGNNSFQISGLSIGSGNNGKSVLNGVNEALLGESNVSHVALQQLDKERFAPADLYGKRINICGDLPSKPLTDTAIFKKIVSGDRIRAERKFQQPFDFKPKVILWFSTNKLPETPDKTWGFYRRFVFIRFLNNFEGREDIQLLSKLTTEEELSGFLNLVLEYLKWIKRTGKFPGLESIEEREETYNQIQNPVEYFLEECVEEKFGEYITKEEMYETFTSWCKTKNLPAETKESFGSKLSQKGFKTVRRTSHGNRYWAWNNLSIVNTTPKED